MGSTGRKTWVGVAIGAVVVVLLGAIWLRPPEAAEQIGEVAPVRATAPVERRMLADSVTTRGTVVGSGSVDVVQRSAPEGGDAIIATLPVDVGDAVANGDLLVVVSGRPVFAVLSAEPMSRRLVPGTTGADVIGFQSALRGLGYEVADEDGTFSSSTQAAVEAFYRDRGFVAPSVGGDDGVEVVASLALEVENAQARVAEAEAAAAADTAELDATAVRDMARLELEHARRSLALTDGSDAVAHEMASQRVETADLAAQVAEQRLASVRRDQDREVAVASARHALDAGREALRRAEETSGPYVDLNEFVALPAQRSVVSEVLVSLGQTLNDSAPIMRLSTGELAVRARLTDGQAALVTDGMTAEVIASNGSPLAGTVSGEPTSETIGGETSMIAMIHLDDVSGLRLGTNVQVTITSAVSPGPVLAVPTVAVSTDASGQHLVLVADGDGHRQVRIEAGASAGGYTEITGSEPNLAAGDMVITAGAP